MKIEKNKLEKLYFDCHTHFGFMLSSTFNDKMPYCQNIVGILEKMNGNSVNACLTFPFPDDFVGCEVLPDTYNNQMVRDIFEKVPYLNQNERLLLEVETFGNGLVFPVLMFSIKYGINEQINYLSNCVKDHYIYGLKYYPEADNLSFSQFEVLGCEFIEFLEENNLPLIIHSSASTVVTGNGLSHPRFMLELAMKHPKLRICIAHMAHFSKEVFNTLQNYELANLYIDTSPFLHLCNIRNVMPSTNCLQLDYKNPLNVLNHMVDNYSSHIIWGSDYPFNYTCNLKNEFHDKNYKNYSYEKNLSILNNLDNWKFKMITHNNTLRFLYG